MLIIVLPLFIPIQTVRPYYKVLLAIKLNPPPHIKTYSERMDWLNEQLSILNSEKLLRDALERTRLSAEEISKQLPFIRDNLYITIAGSNILSIELIASEEYKLKTVTGEMVAVYFDMANKVRETARVKIYESQKLQLKSLNAELKNARAAFANAKTALENFQANKMIDDTQHIKSEIDKLKTRLSELKMMYTEEHPQVKEISTQIAEKTKKLDDKQIQLSEERKKATALKDDYQEKREELDRLSEKYKLLKRAQIVSKVQDVGNIITGPELIEAGPEGTKILDLAGKLLFGIAMALAASFITERLDKTAWNESEIKHDLGIRTLGTIAKYKDKPPYRLLIDCSKDSEIVKSFEIFRSNIQFVNLATPLKSILYCSLLKEQEDFLAANLAISMIFIGGRVGLINATGKLKKYNRLLISSDSKGFKNMSEPISISDTIVKNLKTLDIKDLNISEKQRANEFIASLKEKFDVIIIDSSTIVDSVQVAALASAVDGVILGAKIRKTEREFILRNYKILSEVKARVLGVILQW